jgi:hypothetical protein
LNPGLLKYLRNWQPMNWSDFSLNPSSKTLRQFAAAWLLFFSLLGTVHYFARDHRSLGLTLGMIALAGGGPGLIQPRLIRWLFVGSMFLSFPIGWAVSQVTLAVMFFGILTPLALWFGIRRRDSLLRKQPGVRNSYWLAKECTQNVKNYFREY